MRGRVATKARPAGVAIWGRLAARLCRARSGQPLRQSGESPDEAATAAACRPPRLTADDIDVDWLRELESGLIAEAQLLGTDGTAAVARSGSAAPGVIRPGCLVRIATGTGAGRCPSRDQLPLLVYRTVEVRPGPPTRAVIVPVDSGTVEPDLLCVPAAELQAIVPWQRKGRAR